MFKKQRFENFLYSDFWKFVKNTIETKMYSFFKDAKIPVPMYGEEAVIFLNDFIAQTKKLFSKYEKHAPTIWSTELYDEKWLEHFSDECIHDAEVVCKFIRMERLKEDIARDNELSESTFQRNLVDIETIKYLAKNDVSDYILNEVMCVAETITAEYFHSINEPNPYYFGFHQFIEPAPTSDYLFSIKFLHDKRDSFGVYGGNFYGFTELPLHLKFHHYEDEFYADSHHKVDKLYKEAIKMIDSDEHIKDYEELLLRRKKK